MERNLIYLNNCAVLPGGKVNSFLMQEAKWLTGHFERAFVVSHSGFGSLNRDGVELPLARTGLDKLRAWLNAPFCRELWQEANRLRKDRQLTLKNFLKLYLFRVRGLKMHYWTEKLLRSCVASQTTLYSFWMSYDAYAAALSKRKHPRLRFVARGHAYDIDTERNPMNPYLMKNFIAAQADGLYPISRVARKQMMEYLRGKVDEKRMHVLSIGSGGHPVESWKRAPRFAQGIFRIITCARLVPIKQVPLVVEALSQWTGMPIHWTHIGGGEGEAELRRLAAEKLDGKNNILYELLGDLDAKEVEKFYEKRAFDVFLNTSQKEGVPVSIMEAMRWGVPVIAPAVGGIPEVVTKDIGFLYQPEEGADGVVKRLEAMVSLTEEETERMRRSAWEHWKRCCCSSALLPALFPEAAKKGGKGQ